MRSQMTGLEANLQRVNQENEELRSERRQFQSQFENIFLSNRTKDESDNHHKEKLYDEISSLKSKLEESPVSN